MSFLYSQRGYVKVSDTFHPDEFYLATFSELRDLKHTIGRKIGSFKIVFNRKPQRYLRSGNRVSSFSDVGSLKNPTTFDALPLIRAYGTGSFTIGDISVAITSADTYTDIDCELQEAYKGSVNCNGNITLTDGVFPHFAPGVNNISMTGITSLEITPRWWRI
jgi:phage-related protein